jgi:hypothetical protein
MFSGVIADLNSILCYNPEGVKPMLSILGTQSFYGVSGQIIHVYGGTRYAVVTSGAIGPGVKIRVLEFDTAGVGTELDPGNAPSIGNVLLGNEQLVGSTLHVAGYTTAFPTGTYYYTFSLITKTWTAVNTPGTGPVLDGTSSSNSVKMVVDSLSNVYLFGNLTIGAEIRLGYYKRTAGVWSGFNVVDTEHVDTVTLYSGCAALGIDDSDRIYILRDRVHDITLPFTENTYYLSCLRTNGSLSAVQIVDGPFADGRTLNNYGVPIFAGGFVVWPAAQNDGAGAYNLGLIILTPGDNPTFVLTFAVPGSTIVGNQAAMPVYFDGADYIFFYPDATDNKILFKKFSGVWGPEFVFLDRAIDIAVPALTLNAVSGQSSGSLFKIGNFNFADGVMGLDAVSGGVSFYYVEDLTPAVASPANGFHFVVDLPPMFACSECCDDLLVQETKTEYIGFR